MVKKNMSGFLIAQFLCSSEELGLITILGQDEEETDAKNWTSWNSTSELTNPLENSKKNNSGFWIAQFWCPS